MNQQLIDGLNVKIERVVLVILAILALDFIINSIRKVMKSKKDKRIIHNLWGKEPKKKYIASDFVVLADFFKYKRKSTDFIHVIDDITWNDINMNKIFARINNALSTLGENVLYFILRTPIFNEEDLNKRDKYIEFFTKAKAKREKLQDIIINIGEERNASIIHYILTEQPRNKKRKIAYITLSLIFIASVIGIMFRSKYFLALFFISTITNAIVYYKTGEKREDKIQIVRYVSKIILASKQICKSDFDEINEYNVRLKKAYKKLKNIHWKSAVLLRPLDLDVLSFLKVFLLFELIIYEDLISSIYKYKEEVMETYEVIGYIDALISIASYRESLEYYVKPELVDKNEELIVDCDDIYHPLINNPVKNSILTEESVLLTGSNATGKSTFIKTVAINSILAQTIYTCCATKYRSNYFKTYTSMALQDNLLNNESYFIVEIKSLKRILNNINHDIPVLCFIDEILRGTNTIERIAASSQVLKYLKAQNCLCFAATHDIELTDILKNHYVNYHFQEKIVNNEVIFDYKLYKDKTTSRNAIKLLEIIGYDKKIIDDALLSIDEYTSKNEWLIL